MRLRRLQAAIEAGVDPAALVQGINEAQAERTAAKAELETRRFRVFSAMPRFTR